YAMAVRILYQELIRNLILERGAPAPRRRVVRRIAIQQRHDSVCGSGRANQIATLVSQHATERPVVQSLRSNPRGGRTAWNAWCRVIEGHDEGIRMSERGNLLERRTIESIVDNGRIRRQVRRVGIRSVRHLF